jgi:hypothetical protein
VCCSQSSTRCVLGLLLDMHKQFFLLGRLCTLTLVLSCCAATSSTLRTVELGSPVTLAPNDTVGVSGTPLRIQFTSIATDSRCPRNTTCVWEGRVIARFSISESDVTMTHELSPTESVPIGTHKLTFDAVQPDRLTEAKISAQDYRVTIRVE